jgi:hypothetical protein
VIEFDSRSGRPRELRDGSCEAIGVGEVGKMVGAVDRQQLGVRQVRGEVFAATERDDLVTAVVDDQSRMADMREQVGDV